MEKPKAIIEAINIKKSFGNLRTLEDISLTLEKNQIVTLLGPSGCGKSTLFDIISGLEKPDKGQILIEGKDYIGKTGRVSYMHQKDLLLPWNTILNNVCISLIIKGFKRSQSYKKAAGYFRLFGLEGFENHYPKQLSGGMKQRAALLRTYLFADDIMLLDEPFGSLDAITRRKMQFWLLGILENLKSSVLFITHDIDEAIFLSDKIYLLSKRPAVVKEIFNVNIKKPRENSTLTSKEFIKIKEKILDIL
ncbi:MAG: ABC transporter ATP-binding protein [Actinobacteria bacterium]|nr:ABC transporter ATP-binding protein [Actinomycetota bacterium]